MQDLIAQRLREAELHDGVRARFPNTAYRTPQFGAALAPIATRLGAIARAMTDSADATPAEIARSWMWYGDALFDLAQGGHVPFAQVIAAYREADPYVRVAKDPVLAAKRDGNLANILLRSTPDVPTLREIIARYEAAIRVLGTAATAGFQHELATARNLLAQFEAFERELDDRKREASALLASIRGHDLAPPVAAAMSELVQQLASFGPVKTLAEAMQIIQAVQQIFPRLMALADEPRVPPPPTRGGRIAALAMQLWHELSAEALAPLDAGLRDDMLATTRALLECANALRAVTGDAGAIEIERARLRDLAATARRLLAHANVTWIEPRWPTPLVVPVISTAHVVAAAADRMALLTAICAARGVAVDPVDVGPDLAERRFNAMRAAAVVIADLTGGPEQCAAACYEIGIALVLGKPIVVLAGAAPLPFDIDIEPVRSADPTAIGEAIDQALIVRQRVGGAGTAGALADLAAAARRRFPDQRFLMDTLDAQVDHPIGIATALQAVLQAYTQQAQGAAIVAYSTWRRRYPTAEPRLFHIMPFRAEWSDGVKTAARRAVEAHAVYRRHDDVADPQILRSLWDELTRATHCLVDLTGLNPNVTLELGVADALGTPTLLVGQPGTVATLFPMIRRTRVTEYATTAELALACGRFVAAVSMGPGQVAGR